MWGAPRSASRQSWLACARRLIRVPLRRRAGRIGRLITRSWSALFAAQLLLGTVVHAESGSDTPDPVTVGPVSIVVPQGFEAAQTQRLKKTLITAWTKSARNGSLKTLL